MALFCLAIVGVTVYRIIGHWSLQFRTVNMMSEIFVTLDEYSVSLSSV